MIEYYCYSMKMIRSHPIITRRGICFQQTCLRQGIGGGKERRAGGEAPRNYTSFLIATNYRATERLQKGYRITIEEVILGRV